ncbi:MAG: helix-turn-helix transcriptional regulator [Acholeplasmatales bacterium]|nr:helix-turn-helix transcriptional regulator [Acholeplasmatales bacterium]
MLRLKELREDSDLTQSYIAKILNISQRSYSHYELEDRQIPLDLLIKLADYYNVSVDYIIGRTNKKRREN